MAGDPSKLATELLTECGYLNAMALLFDQLSSGELTRDQTSALIGARRCLESFAEARSNREQKAMHRELVQELQMTREAMRQRGGGTTSFVGNPLQGPGQASPGDDPN